jgi:hypothetical protein
VDNSSEAIERIKVREVAGVFHSRRALENAGQELLLNGFDRADIDRLASLDELRQRLKTYAPPEEAADLLSAPRDAVFTWDDVTVTLVVAASVIGAAAGVAAVLAALVAGVGRHPAVIMGSLVGLAVAAAAALVIAPVVRRLDLSAAERAQYGRGVIFWVRIRAPDREAPAQEILRRNDGRAVRVHEIEIEKRADELPLGSFNPDPWLRSERLGRL